MGLIVYVELKSWDWVWNWNRSMQSMKEMTGSNDSKDDPVPGQLVHERSS